MTPIDITEYEDWGEPQVRTFRQPLKKHKERPRTIKINGDNEIQVGTGRPERKKRPKDLSKPDMERIIMTDLKHFGDGVTTRDELDTKVINYIEWLDESVSTVNPQVNMDTDLETVTTPAKNEILVHKHSSIGVLIEPGQNQHQAFSILHRQLGNHLQTWKKLQTKFGVEITSDSIQPLLPPFKPSSP